MKAKLETKTLETIWTPELVATMAADLDRGRVILAKTGSWNTSTEKWSK